MSKQALISPKEPRETGYRIAQVEPDDKIFEVASPMFWTPCNDDVKADFFWYDPKDEIIKPVPILDDLNIIDNETGQII